MESRDLAMGRKVRPWNRVPFRLGLGVLLVTWAVLALGFLLFEKRQEQLFTNLYVDAASSRSQIVISLLTERMLVGGGEEIWSAVSEEAARSRDIAHAASIRVFNGDGLIRASSESTAVGTRIEVRNNPDCPYCDSTRPGDFPAVATVTASDGTTQLRIVNIVPFTQPCLRCHAEKRTAHGLISFDYDLWPLIREAAERRNDMLAMGLFAGFLVMGVTALLFRLLVMRSVDSIARSAKRLAAGDLGARAHVVGTNELAVLAHEFNHMAGRIEQQVSRIDAAHTESELLYTLVVEASKNLETGDVAGGVARVLLQKLRPRHIAFFLETAGGGWICVSGRSGEDIRMASGEEALEEALSARAMQLRPLLAEMPAQIVADACRMRELRSTSDADGLTFALPVVADGRLAGLLACVGIPAGVPVADSLLHNLGVHLTLAAINSRNYTGAVTDGLTGLKNKRYGLIRLEEAVHAAKRYKTGLVVVMCDIDHFKRVNDTYGHLAGDAVLKEVSRRISACVRKADVVLRYGGEEFMLILPQTEAHLLAAFGEKIRQAVAATPVDLRAAGVSLALTISVGVAALRPDSENGEAVVARADKALYRAKEGGRNRVEVDL